MTACRWAAQIAVSDPPQPTQEQQQEQEAGGGEGGSDSVAAAGGYRVVGGALQPIRAVSGGAAAALAVAMRRQVAVTLRLVDGVYVTLNVLDGTGSDVKPGEEEGGRGSEGGTRVAVRIQVAQRVALDVRLVRPETPAVTPLTQLRAMVAGVGRGGATGQKR